MTTFFLLVDLPLFVPLFFFEDLEAARMIVEDMMDIII